MERREIRYYIKEKCPECGGKMYFRPRGNIAWDLIQMKIEARAYCENCQYTEMIEVDEKTAKFLEEGCQRQYVCDTCQKFLFSKEEIEEHAEKKNHVVHWIPIFKLKVIETLSWIKGGCAVPLTHYNPCGCCWQITYMER